MALAAVVAYVLVAIPAFAADSPQNVGVVDLAKVYRDAPRVKQYKEELDKQTEYLGKQLEIRSQNLMLDENQVKELIDLKLKAAASLTDKDKARISELESIEKALDAEFKQLQGTAQLDEAQKTRLKQLQELQRNSKTAGEALEKDYNARLQTKAIELDEKARTDIQESVNKVAGAKKLDMVYAKDAVLFGGIDITDDVVNNLDRKAQ